jgi:uncharacterized OsmC-like protein
MTSTVKYLGDLRTEATHVKSGTSIITDAPTDNNGLGTTFSPTDLVATSLAACAMTIMGIAAGNHNIDMVGAHAEVTKVMGSDPRRISKIVVHITMPDKVYSDKEKTILSKAAASCPVAQSLHPDLEQALNLIYAD